MKVRMIGMIKKVISNTPAGTSISQATAAGLLPGALLRGGGATAVAAAGVGSRSVVLTGGLLKVLRPAAPASAPRER
jgi:hypothetical protein